MILRRTSKPPRPYGALLNSLRKAWKVSPVTDDQALSFFGKGAQPAFSPANIKVAVWNMCKGAGGVLFEHDYRVLCYTSEIILTQEALLSERARQAFCLPGFQLIHAASYKRRDGVVDGVMTVSKVGATPQCRRLLCKYPEPIFKTPKAGLISFFPLEGLDETLMVINLHATLVRSKWGAIDEMKYVMERIPDHHGPTLFAGDFNVFTNGYLKAIDEILAQKDLIHVEIKDDPRPRLGQLDHVFIKGLKVENIMVDTTFKSSDHFPLCLNLSIDFKKLKFS